MTMKVGSGVALCIALIPSFWMISTNGFMHLPTLHHTASIGKTIRTQRYARDNEDDQDPQKTSDAIPQLPPIGSSSFDLFTHAALSKEEPTAAFVNRKFDLQYTCNVCGTRNCHKVSRQAYYKGVVITTCKGCERQHLIADNLGFTNMYEGNIEDFLIERGSEEVVTRVSEEVFHLERVLAIDSKSGSLPGEDGGQTME